MRVPDGSPMTMLAPRWLGFLGAMAASAAAAAAPCGDIHTLPASLPLFAERSPDVQSATEAHLERVALDGDIPTWVGNPLVRATLGPRLVPESDIGAEGALGVYLPVQAAGQGLAQRRSAEWTRAAILAERDQLVLDASIRGVRAWLALHETEAQLALATEEAALAAEWAALLRRGVEARVTSAGEAARMDAYLAEAELEVRALEGNRFDHAVELGALLGCDVGAEPLVLADELPAAPTGDLLLARADAHPRVALLERELAALDEERAALLRAAYGSIEVGLVAEKDGPGNYRALLEVQAPLPVVEQAAIARGDLALRAARLRAAREQALRATHAELRRALHEVAHTAEVLEVARARLEPAAEEAVRLEETAYQSGTLPVTEWLHARRERLRARRTRSAAFVAHARARWELALLHEAIERRVAAE